VGVKGFVTIFVIAGWIFIGCAQWFGFDTGTRGAVFLYENDTVQYKTGVSLQVNLS